MAIATIRLGRRSKEIIRMNMVEVGDAICKEVDGERFYFIEVADQKSGKFGKLAPVAFSESEYFLLKKFIKYTRPSIVHDSSSEIVFPSSSGMNVNSAEPSFGAAHRILQKFETSSGKKLSSRVARSSKVTNTYKRKLSEGVNRVYATAMNHSVAVAHDHYNFNEVSDAAADVIAMDLAMNKNGGTNDLTLCSELNYSSQTSLHSVGASGSDERAQLSAILNANENSSSLIHDSTSNADNAKVPSTSTPVRANSSLDAQNFSIAAEDMEVMDETIKVLRRKKIKVHRLRRGKKS